MTDVAVVGGGAAGFMAAITAALSGARGVSVFEKNGRALKKLLATGNGRCNYTNRRVTDGRGFYFGEDAGFCEPAVKAFNASDAATFFKKLGIEPYDGENGRVYPMSLQAGSVVDALRLKAGSLNIDVKTDANVSGVKEANGGFAVFTGGRESVPAKTVIIATGGHGGGGYDILKSLGHRVTRLTPALCRLISDSPLARGLAGIKAEGSAAAYYKGRVVALEAGEILFTETGLSGDAIFALSVNWHTYPGFSVFLDFARDTDEAGLVKLFAERRENLKSFPAEYFLNGFINKKIGAAVMKAAGAGKLNAPAAGLPDETLARAAALVKRTAIPIKGVDGFGRAQVTAGGAETGAFNPRTLESRLVPGLFAAGEVLDVTGMCGGFNLQWAWSSGRLAGAAAARRANLRDR
jgi:predicted Rossmann fold flavoprotein